MVAGHRTWLPLPWGLVDSFPLASHALPARAMVLVWLALAVIVALFLTRRERLRWLLFVLTVLTLVPDLNGGLWVTPLDRPSLFQGDRWRAIVRPGENAFIIPYSYDGQAMLWQQESGFGFRMAGGYVSATIPAVTWKYPIVRRSTACRCRRSPRVRCARSRTTARSTWCSCAAAGRGRGSTC